MGSHASDMKLLARTEDQLPTKTCCNQDPQHAALSLHVLFLSLSLFYFLGQLSGTFIFTLAAMIINMMSWSHADAHGSDNNRDNDLSSHELHYQVLHIGYTTHVSTPGCDIWHSEFILNCDLVLLAL
eukprot:scpid73604/ scgid23490/ 